MQSLDIIIPVYNEEIELKPHVLKLKSFCEKNLKHWDWKIVIADNASKDNTLNIAKKLKKAYKHIEYISLPQKGRGRAIKKSWIGSKADIVSYMDVDLSTDLKHFPSLINSLVNGFDIAIGSRLLRKSKVKGRTLKREIISRCYNLIIKIFFRTKFSDAQCGFKAATRNVVKNLIPNIIDNEWFFDSEMLIVGEKLGYKIYEEPVLWIDNPGSTVKVMKTASGDLKGLWRLFTTCPWKKIKINK